MEKKITTLIVVHQGNKILLGLKKRGFGVNRWNGFGGKLHEGETIEQAAKREMLEEANVSVNDLKKVGIMEFYWKHKPNDCVEVHVFKSNAFTGTPTEGEEMKPQWFSVSEIPFDQMWKDDAFWMPMFLDGKKFKGKFVFDDTDNILEKELVEVNEI